MVRSSIILALCVALLVACGACVAEVIVSATAYDGESCGTALGDPITWSNGSCAVFSSGSTDVSCDENGSPAGKFCPMATNCGGNLCTDVSRNASVTWGQGRCFAFADNSIEFVCSEGSPTTPTSPLASPSAPEASPVSSPVSSPVIVSTPASEPTSAPVTSPVDGALISSGNVTVQLFFSNDCRNPPLTTASLFANFSRCQQYTYSGTTFSFYVDCYITGYSKVVACSSDDCTSCSDVPSTASGQCTAYSVSLIRSVKATCPPYVPSASPSTTPTSTPGSTPSTTPGSDATSLLASSIFVFAAIAAVTFF